MEMIFLDGEFLPADKPVLMSYNRSFRYGDGLFESIRVVDGKPCYLADHLERMRRGLGKLQIDLPVEYTDAYIEGGIRDVLDRNDIREGGKVRLTVFRKGGGLYTPSSSNGSLLLEANSVATNEYELNHEGYNVDLYEEQRKLISDFGILKSNSALFFVMAGLYKRKNKLDECIVINDMGNICEGVSSNIFIIFNGVLYTPSEGEGCLPGVMRKQLIRIAHANRLEVQECPLNPAVLLKADEVLFTNAVNGIRWALSYRGKRYYSDIARKLVALLNAELTNSA